MSAYHEKEVEFFKKVLCMSETSQALYIHSILWWVPVVSNHFYQTAGYIVTQTHINDPNAS